jgi:hypothetical protein
LANYWYILAGGNVIARAPLNIIVNIECLGQNLLLSGEAIATAHGDSIGRKKGGMDRLGTGAVYLLPLFM